MTNLLTRNVLLHETPDNCNYTLNCHLSIFTVSQKLIYRFQSQIISSEDIMNQIVGCLVTPSFGHIVRIKVLCCLENQSFIVMIVLKQLVRHVFPCDLYSMPYMYFPDSITFCSAYL